jgi:hypothetical protein
MIGQHAKKDMGISVRMPLKMRIGTLLHCSSHLFDTEPSVFLKLTADLIRETPGDLASRAVPNSFTLQLACMQGGHHDMALHATKLSN